MFFPPTHYLCLTWRPDRKNRNSWHAHVCGWREEVGVWVCGRKQGDARGHVLEEQLSGIMNICVRAAQEANSAMGGGKPQDVEAIMTICSPLSWCEDNGCASKQWALTVVHFVGLLVTNRWSKPENAGLRRSHPDLGWAIKWAGYSESNHLLEKSMKGAKSYL